MILATDTTTKFSYVLGELLEDALYGKRSHNPIDERDVDDDRCKYAVERYRNLTDREKLCLEAFTERMREVRRNVNVLRVLIGMGSLKYVE